MNTYQPQIGTPSTKLSNTYQTPSSKNATSTVQYQTFTTTAAIPQYQYVTITQQAPATGTTTVVNSSVAPIQQSGIRYSQQLVTQLASPQQQTGIIGQPLTVSSYQIQNANINSVSSPRISAAPVQVTSPANNSDLAQSIINKYKSISQSQQIIQQIQQKQQANSNGATQSQGMRQSSTPNNLNSLAQTQKPDLSSPKINYESIQTKISHPIEIAPYSPQYSSPIQAKFFQTESSTKNSAIQQQQQQQQNIFTYQPYRDTSRNASNYVPSTIQNVPENGGTLNTYKSNGNLNQSFNQLNTSKFNSISMIPDKVSDKLIDEFQKLTESNLKFFMQNKQKWKEIEESLKHENDDLKLKISMLHESYSQINKSMIGGAAGTKPDISFSIQKDLDIATTYEQKVLLIQKELERSHKELEDYRKKNQEAQKKNDELNHTCTQLNEQLNTVIQKTIEGKTVQIDEYKLDQVKQQYERKLYEEQQQYSQNLQNMKNQISELETSLIQEKATTQKLQTDILNLTNDQIIVGSNNTKSSPSYNNQQIENIKSEYENIISVQRQQFNQELLNVNQKIYELESSLTTEKFNNKKLQGEIQNLSTLVAEQSRIYDPVASSSANSEETKRKHEEMLSNLRKQHQEEINRISSQIALLEYQLANEKTTNQKLQNEIQNISISQININSTKIPETQIQDKELQIQQLKKQFEETVLNQKIAYEQEVQKMNKQVEILEQSLIEEKTNSKKLEYEIQNISCQYGNNNDEEIQNLKKQVEELHNQNLKINQQNMELTQTQLAMAQLANENNPNTDNLLSEIQNLKNLNETLNLKNEELVQAKEKEIQERTEEYRMIIQKMEQESFSVIQHVEERGEKEVRNQANNMDSILYENQIEELNETIRQLQQQLEVQHVPNSQKQLTESPEVVRIYKKEDNLINIQENFVNQDEEDSSQLQQKDEQQEIISLKEEVVKQREECDKLKEKIEQEYNTNEDLRQNLSKIVTESEEQDTKYKKQISDIESKLFLHIKEIAEKKQLIEDLEKSKKALAEQVFSYEEKEHNLHQQVVEAKEQLAKIQAETKFQIQEAEKRHSTSSSQILNENEMKISKLKSEIQQVQSEYQLKIQQSEQQYTTQINQLNSQIQTLTNQTQEKNALIEEKERKIEEQIQVAKKFEERIAEMVKEREDLLKHDKDIELQSKQLKEIMEKEYKHQLDVQISLAKKLETELEASKQKYQSQVDLFNEQVKKCQVLEVQLNENKEKQQQLELQWNNQKKEIEEQNNQVQFELKNKLSELEKTIASQTHEEHQLKNDLEKYQNQLAQIAGQLNQKETQLNLFKKENSALSSKIQQIDEENNTEKQELTQKIEKLEAQQAELQQKYDKQVKQYERVKKEKEENDLLADEEIHKLKQNYEALLESEKAAKEDVKKEFITKVDELKIQVARHDTKTRQTEDKHQKQVKTLEKEVESLKQLNNKKIETMKTIQETCKKLEEEKGQLESQYKKKEQKFIDELKEKNEEIEVLTQQKKKINEIQNELQEKLIAEQKKVSELSENQEKLAKELQQSEEKKISIEKEWIQKNQQTIAEYESKISEKDAEFEKILSSKQGDSSQQIQELSSKNMKQEKEFREKENNLNNKINTLQSSVKNHEEKLKSLEEENSKLSTQLSEKIAVLNKEIDTHKASIKENQNQIEAFEKEIKEKNQIIKNLESDKSDLEEKTLKQEEKIVLISTQLEQTKASKKEIEDKLSRKIKEKETEQNIISQDYNQKIQVYKQTIEHLQNNSRQGDINFSQDLKFSQISKITDNLSDNNSHDEQADKLSGKELSQRLMSGVAALSQSRASVSSIRSKEETRSMYKKLSQMSMATAAMMSVKRDYVSLKELAKSIDDHDVNNTSNQEDIDPRLTKSEIQHK
ncbi:hypothetical protein TTHERM_00006350 (macronuclear) [Tetrahymena thermophila SB210]|uniref:Uncharacterized protein n=1 Tax=Tetrahymena thermophila (strain SB210) TaxID=312017 RepID=Q22SA1_TETTS|nr:hypothetical protein TTHERM_00006350 [Tetrahymena thermophila SB210]EAR87871.2 hypothetical protein TTHERM_00006350 [Tetrahymena thermophila SB210]|eukprot:XP_001008116.2 hypothetical protein TTHERM_00006350 [Tetrahymena thermophila SB210]